MVFRVSEVYASSQGEGPNVGKTTVFLRFGGCNLRCNGWPCDTQHAIQPEFRHDWKRYEVTELLDHVLDVADMSGAEMVTLTGGEPFLQKNSDLQELVEGFIHQAGFVVEAFSNGTIEYPDWAPRMINFIMDWKLPGSEEDPHNEIRFKNLEKLNRAMKVRTFGLGVATEDVSQFQAIKFVCKDWDDLIYAHSLWDVHVKDQLSFLETFYSKVWDGGITDAELVEYVMKYKLPWRLNLQTHNLIWPANERGR